MNLCNTKLYFNPLSPNSDDNEISLYLITAFSNIQVMRIQETITKEGKDVLTFRQILPTSSIPNVWRTVKRICLFISGPCCK